MTAIQATRVRNRLAIVAIIAILAVAFERQTPIVRAVHETFTVTSGNDVNDGDCELAPGHCSLREAILAANGNNNGQVDTIRFNMPGVNGPWVILPTAALPFIQEGVTIDGFCGTCDASANTASTSQAINASYGIVLSGALAGNVDGLTINSNETVTIRGLVVIGWEGAGIYVAASGSHVIAGNFIGTNRTGTGAPARKAACPWV